MAVPGIGLTIATPTIVAIGKGAAFKKGRVARSSAWPTLPRRQAAADRHQQARQQIPPQALRAGSPYRAAKGDEAVGGPEHMAGPVW